MPAAVEIAGSGEAVVFVHGLGGTANVWAAQAGIVSRHFKAIRPDLPGSGRSPRQGEISTPALAEWLLALLRDQGLEAAHLVGHSYGSVICQHAAAAQPAQIRSLTLIGPILAPSDAMRQALRDRAATARAEGLVGIADATVLAGTSAETKAHRPEVAGFVRELVMRQDAECYAQTCEAIAATQPADLSAVRCPALVLTGDEDATAPPAVARAVADALGGATLRVLRRCGHWTPIERAAEVSEHLIDFLFAQRR